jgi:hypothetical protein
MELRNSLDLDTRWGFRSLQVWWGDITAFDSDLLIISAVDDDLSPMEGTVIGALCKDDMSVERLRHTAEFDLRLPVRLWASSKTGSQGIRAVMCVHIPFGSGNVDRIIKRVFLALPILAERGLRLDTVSLPMLGAGGHGLNPADFVHALIEAAQEAFYSLEPIKRICFVEIDHDRAETISHAMDTVLNRVQVVLARGQIVDALRKEVEDRIGRLEKLDPNIGKVLADLRGALREARSTFIGTAGRKVREYVIGSILNGRVHITRDEEFRGLTQKHVADWIISYLNLLRTFGNHSVHEIKSDIQRPPEIDTQDITLLLFTIQRVLDFWISWMIAYDEGDGGALISGAIDIVRQDDPPRVTLIDFKSGDAASDNHQKLDEQEMMLQVAIYAVAAKKELQYQPERGLVRYLDPKEGERRELPVPLDPNTIRESAKLVSRTARRIRDREFKVGPTSGNGKELRCVRCDFVGLCGMPEAAPHKCGKRR